MIKSGIVDSIENSKITIKIERDSSCGDNCAMCNACPGKEMFITTYTKENFNVGDYVRLETNTSLILLSAFLVYILPIILLIVGYVIISLYFGLALMVISFIILFIYDKKINIKHMVKVSKVH